MGKLKIKHFSKYLHNLNAEEKKSKNECDISMNEIKQHLQGFFFSF